MIVVCTSALDAPPQECCTVPGNSPINHEFDMASCHAPSHFAPFNEISPEVVGQIFLMQHSVRGLCGSLLASTGVARVQPPSSTHLQSC